MKQTISWNKKRITYSFDSRDEMKRFLDIQRIIEITQKKDKNITVTKEQDKTSSEYIEKD